MSAFLDILIIMSLVLVLIVSTPAIHASAHLSAILAVLQCIGSITISPNFVLAQLAIMTMAPINFVPIVT